MEKEGSDREEAVSKRNEKLLKRKFYLDKIGYGFSSTQFINILFSFTGASFLLIGITNGLKSFFNTLISTFIKEITEKRDISKSIISFAGLIFGFSFLILALAVILELKYVFAIVLLVGGISVTIYGELFNSFLNRYSKKGKINRLSSTSTFKGLLISAISIILAAGILDLTIFGGQAITINILGKTINQNIYGYLLTFEVTAFAFIISSYVFAKVKVPQENILRIIDYNAYFLILIQKSKQFLSNKYLLVMTSTTLIVSVFQSIINSFTGIYVYEHLKTAWFGGFMNVGVMYALALMVALLGPLITSKINKAIGVIPMFVFGTILLAMLPLTIVFTNMYYPAIVVANSFSVLGAAIIGSAQGILASRVLSLEDRKRFYSAAGFLTLAPFIVAVTILSFVANNYGLAHLFKIMGFGLIILATPLYFLLVIWASNKKNGEL